MESGPTATNPHGSQNSKDECLNTNTTTAKGQVPSRYTEYISEQMKDKCGTIGKAFKADRLVYIVLRMTAYWWKCTVCSTKARHFEQDSLEAKEAKVVMKTFTFIA
jgi:hypothetical protein